MFSLPVPEEPVERSVVLDREAVAWQRYGTRWFRTAQLVPVFGGIGDGNGLAWAELLVRNGPLAPMVAESSLEDDVPSSPDVEDADVVEDAGPVSATPVGCDSPSVLAAAVTDGYATAPSDQTTEQGYPSALWGDSIVAPPRPSPRPRPVVDRPQA